MTEVSVEIRGLDELTKRIEKFPAISEKHVNKAINRSLIRVLGEAKREAPFGVSGGLRDRWDVIVGRFTGVLRSGVGYAKGVEEGTPPHKVSASAIAPWAIKKGLNPWAVAKSIEKKGTKANPFLQRAVNHEEGNINKEFGDALENIIEEIK